MKQGQINLPNEHQPPSSSSSPRQRNKLYFTLFLIITLFTVIIFSIVAVFTVLKRDIESEYPALTSSDNLVKEVCRALPFDRHCNKSMSSFLQLHINRGEDDIYSADILKLLISEAYDQILAIKSLPKELRSTYKNSPADAEKALANCQAHFEGSLELLNKSLSVISEHHFETKNKDGMFFINYDELVIIEKARGFINDARNKLQGCLDGLEGVKGSAKWIRSDEKKSFESRAKEAEEYVSNAFAALDNKDGLDEILFKPTVSSVFASLIMDRDSNYVMLVTFCSQYLFLMLLCCGVLRVFRSQNR